MPTKTSPEKPGRVYVLTDPKSGAIRYCGITILSVKDRFIRHKSSVTMGKHSDIYQWMKDLRDEGLEPVPHLVEECTDPDREVYWIALLHEMGCDLLNMDHGGVGKGRVNTPEWNANIAASHKGKPLSREHRLAQVRGRKPHVKAARSAPAQAVPAAPAEQSVTDMARVESPLLGTVLGKDYSRLRDIARRVAEYDALHRLEVIEG